MEDLTGDGGVLKKILRPGTGPVVPKGATVRCMYIRIYELYMYVEHVVCSAI